MSFSNKKEQREAQITDTEANFPTARIRLGENLTTTQYKTLQELENAYRIHANKNGYAIVQKCQYKQKVLYMCDKSEKPRDRKNKDLHESKRRKTGSQKCNCPFRSDAKQLVIGKWEGSVDDKKDKSFHNHLPSDDTIVHTFNRIRQIRNDEDAFKLVSQLLARGTAVSTIRAQLRENWDIKLTCRDIYNLGQKLRSQ